MLGYDYEISYKKGKDNVAADALSRKFKDVGTLHTLSLPTLDWIQEVQQEWKQDVPTQQLIQQLITDSTTKPGYSWDG